MKYWLKNNMLIGLPKKSQDVPLKHKYVLKKHMKKIKDQQKL